MKYIKINESLNDRKLARDYIKMVGSIDPINNVGYVNDDEIKHLSELDVKYEYVPVDKVDIPLVLDCSIKNHRPHDLIDNVRFTVDPFRENFENKDRVLLTILFNEPLKVSIIKTDINEFISDLISDCNSKFEFNLERDNVGTRVKYDSETMTNMEHKRLGNDSFNPDLPVLIESIHIPFSVNKNEDTFMCIIQMEDDQLPILKEERNKMNYLKDYKLFEDEEKKSQSLTDELKEFGRDLKQDGKQLQDLVLQMAKSDKEIADKMKNRSNEEEKEEVNEGIALGLALSSGAVLELTGKLLSFAGKKLSKDDNNKLTKVGMSIEKYGHKVHHGIINLIKTILKPLIFWMSPKKQEFVSTAVFMAILAIKLSSGSVDISDYKSFSGFAEGLLNGIKTTEISAFLKDAGRGLITLVKGL